MTPKIESFTTDTNMTGYTSAQTIYPQRLHLWRVIRVNNDGTYDAVSEYVSDTSVYFGTYEATEESNIQGINGYKNLVGYLNVLASKYENDDFTEGSRIMGYNGQTEYISDTSAFDGTSNEAPWSCSTGESCNPDETKGGGDELYITDTDLVKAQYNNSLKAYQVDTSGNPTSKDEDYWLGSRFYLKESWYFVFSGRFIGNKYVSYFQIRGYGGSWDNVDPGFALRPIITLSSTLKASGFGTSDYPYVLVK